MGMLRHGDCYIMMERNFRPVIAGKDFVFARRFRGSPTKTNTKYRWVVKVMSTTSISIYPESEVANDKEEM